MLTLVASNVDGPITLNRPTYITRDELKDLVWEKLERDLARQQASTHASARTMADDVDLSDVDLPDSVNLEDLMR